MVMLDGEETPRSDASGEGGGDPERELANFMPGEGGEEPGANRGAGEDAAGAGGSRLAGGSRALEEVVQVGQSVRRAGFHVFLLVTVSLKQWCVGEPVSHCRRSSLPYFC